MGPTVVGVSVLVGAAVVVQFGTLWGLAVLALLLLGGAAVFLFTDLFSE